MSGSSLEADLTILARLVVVLVSDVEARRREAIGPFVVEQRSSFYSGRELGIPGR